MSRNESERHFGFAALRVSSSVFMLFCFDRRIHAERGTSSYKTQREGHEVTFNTFICAVSYNSCSQYDKPLVDRLVSCIISFIVYS